MSALSRAYALALAFAFVPPASANAGQPSPGPRRPRGNSTIHFVRCAPASFRLNRRFGVRIFGQLYAGHGTRVSWHVTLIGSKVLRRETCRPELSGAFDDRRTDASSYRCRSRHRFTISSSTRMRSTAKRRSHVLRTFSRPVPARRRMQSRVTASPASPPRSCKSCPNCRAAKPTSRQVPRKAEPIVGHYGDKPRSILMRATSIPGATRCARP